MSINLNSLMTTQNPVFLELLGNGKSYKVPPYQRNYSWNEENWEDLWNDIVELRNQSDKEASHVHYMGSVVIERQTDRDFLIIDGQQRIATLSIFVLAVINKLNDMAAAGIEPELNRKRGEELRRSFIGIKDPASLLESSKLELNENDDAFYQDYLVQLRQPSNPKSLRGSASLLWKCFLYFSEQLQKVEEYKTQGDKLTLLVSEILARRLMFLAIYVSDESNAYTIFETLNARGMELSATDLLKNYLFSVVQVKDDRKALQRRWKSLVDTVGQKEFPRFLKYHLLCSHNVIRNSNLYKTVRNTIKTSAEVFELLDELERRSELYVALSDAASPYWSGGRENCRKYIWDLVLFDVTQPTPVLFAAWDKLNDKFESVLKMLSIISFRYSTVSSLNPNLLERVYPDVAKRILSGEIKTLQQLFDSLKPVYVEDKKFAQNFSEMVLEPKGQKRKIVRYILAKLEEKLSGKSCDFETDPATIEHILPENPDEVWNESFPSHSQALYINRLGNLTFLKGKQNKDLKNLAYIEKAQAYRNSEYSLSNTIPEFAPEEWTPRHIEDRQNRLADLAIHIWRISY